MAVDYFHSPISNSIIHISECNQTIVIPLNVSSYSVSAPGKQNNIIERVCKQLGQRGLSECFRYSYIVSLFHQVSS